MSLFKSKCQTINSTEGSNQKVNNSENKTYKPLSNSKSRNCSPSHK